MRATNLILAVVLAAGAVASGAARDVPGQTFTFRTQTMGTWASLTLAADDSAAAAWVAGRVLPEFHRVDSLMTGWTATSEVARLNREAWRGPLPVHPDLARVLTTAREIGRDSDGAFDITVEPLVRAWGFLQGTPRVPSDAEIARLRTRVGWDRVDLDAAAGTLALADSTVRIDLGGIAKGYGVDRVAELLRRLGARDALVDLSGNMVLMGTPPDRDHWNVGLRVPDPGADPEALLGRLALTDVALATSGDYEQFLSAGGVRYGHVLDPRTGYPVRGLVSATVVAHSATAADGWATALLVMGPEAARALVAARDDLQAVLVEQDAAGAFTVWVEGSLLPRFTASRRLPAGSRVLPY